MLFVFNAVVCIPQTTFTSVWGCQAAVWENSKLEWINQILLIINLSEDLLALVKQKWKGICLHEEFNFKPFLNFTYPNKVLAED